ncbi:YpmS family protein [Streptococcus sp. DD12]|uniref:YpmS family protein n=1 Tax=Streptococcus sp. DD12 TaxID=1777880 RepID=UPI00079AD7EF|nr:YpmS family protein [Streptococcus sp. DD12]KXT76261.1 YfaA [Streptococcus sp. DD12]
MTHNQTGKKHVIWKWLFFVLLALNLAFVGVVGVRIFWPTTVSQSEQVDTTGAVKIGTLTTSRKEFNQAAASYLKDYTKSSQYRFYATSSQMVFEGSYTFLGYKIPLTCYFDPQVTSSGSIRLKMTSFSVGTLSLPSSEILKYLKGHVDLPQFVSIDIDSETITLQLENMASSATANTFLKAENLDLAQDKISFSIYKKND